ncbi:M48 family metalloprotease [Bacillus andreraoultii]|uniref:M48 family metalloprotease n=1 Tax=Bacillus andreraoultii TaxID=1499685 RepID=UPI00053B4C4C|nr:M48 family metalloprotease [Bacillus andreraoultii]
MTNFSLVLIGIAILLINLTFTISIRWYILHEFEQKKASENLLNTFQTFEMILYFCTVIFAAMISYITYRVGASFDLTIYILAFIPFLYVISQLLISRFLFHKIHKIIRKTESTVKEDLLFFIKMLGIMIIPSILIILFRVYYIQHMGTNEFFLYFVIIFGLFLFFIAYPHLLKYALKARQIESIETKKEITQFLRKQQVENMEVYQFATKKSKTANAMIIGIFKKKIFFSDYLLEHLTIEETCAVLAHELGHYKKKHLLIKVFLIAFAVPLFTGLGYLMDEMEELFDFTIAIPVGVVFILGTLFAYLGFVFLKLTKMQEYQADQYALQIGVSSATYISALTKVAKLNNQPLSVGNLSELLSTHPSLDKRLKKIMDRQC